MRLKKEILIGSLLFTLDVSGYTCPQSFGLGAIFDADWAGEPNTLFIKFELAMLNLIISLEWERP